MSSFIDILTIYTGLNPSFTISKYEDLDKLQSDWIDIAFYPLDKYGDQDLDPYPAANLFATLTPAFPSAGHTNYFHVMVALNVAGEPDYFYSFEKLDTALEFIYQMQDGFTLYKANQAGIEKFKHLTK